MSQGKAPATEVQKKTEPAHQLEQEVARQPEQGSVQQVAPQTAYRRAQVSRSELRPADLLALQRTVGNRGVQRMLMHRSADASGWQQGGFTQERDGSKVQLKVASSAVVDICQQNMVQSVMRVPKRRAFSTTALLGLIQLSPLSDQMSQVWTNDGKGAFFERLRHLSATDRADADLQTFVNTLVGEDRWLAQNLLSHGAEAQWPIHLRVEREMKGWSDSGGKGVVFDILRTANGAQAGNAALTASLNRVFAAGSDDLWLGQNLQAYGPETNWPMSVFIPPSSATADQVQFTANHPLTAYGSDPKANALWTPSSTDHAVAYTKGSSPSLNASFRVGRNFSRIKIPQLQVRVTEGGAVRGTAAATVSGDTVNVTGLSVAGLTGSSAVRSSNYNLGWEASLNGTTWGPITTTGAHLIYWLHATPSASPLYNLAVAKATSYVAGAAAVADRIRSGLRSEKGYDPADSINPDPLTIYADPVAICTDFANLLTLLARSVGLNANTVMFWGGFQSLGKNIWAVLGGIYGNINLVNVRSPNPAFNTPLLPISPSGWAFNYHAISRIDGTLHDAALDRVGIDAQAAHAGKTVQLVELSSNVLPDAKRGQFYSQRIRRRDHSVDVTVRDYGAQITAATFGDVYTILIPSGAPSPFEIPVSWSITGGTLPPGVTLNTATGAIDGTPTLANTFSAQISITAPPSPNALMNTSALTLKVEP